MKCKNCRNLFKRIDDDGTLYDWCGMIVDCPDRDLNRDCEYYQHASNADRIRAMDDEEMADFLNEKMTAAVVLGWESWIDWLKQEAME